MNICYANDSIVKMKLTQIKKIEESKKIYLFLLTDKSKKNKLYFTDSLCNKYKINKYYCYYDLEKKEKINKEVYETSWYQRESKTNITLFLITMFDKYIFNLETEKILCEKIKKNKNKNINYKWEITTSEKTKEYSNFRFSVGEILFYKNISGIISKETFTNLND